MADTWTITELADAAAVVLRESETVATDGNGRVRDLPNERAIRWYATIGLVDPPLTRRGRVARYGRRHLLQLVAVKRRQAEGRSLAEIQAELVGATDLALERIARLPDEAARSQPRPASPTEPAPAAPGRFWAARPASPTPSAAAEGPSVITGLSLAPGVTLLLDPAPQHLTNADVAALTAAAGPLLAAIRERGLTPAPSDPDSRRKGSQP